MPSVKTVREAQHRAETKTPRMKRGGSLGETSRLSSATLAESLAEKARRLARWHNVVAEAPVVDARSALPASAAARTDAELRVSRRHRGPARRGRGRPGVGRGCDREDLRDPRQAPLRNPAHPLPQGPHQRGGGTPRAPRSPGLRAALGGRLLRGPQDLR